MTIRDDLRTRDLLDVAEDCARQHHLTVGDMFGGRRQPGVRSAQRSFWAYLRAIGWSFPQIGKLCGRDHTTVMYALRAPGRAA
jgi:chromosomal replication initiation ATPase DnaA